MRCSEFKAGLRGLQELTERITDLVKKRGDLEKWLLGSENLVRTAPLTNKAQKAKKKLQKLSVL